MMITAVCLTMTAHAETLDHESLGHVLNDGRDLTFDTPGGITKAHLYSLLKSIGTEAHVRFSAPAKSVFPDGEEVYIFLSTPTALNQDIRVMVHAESVYMVAVDRDAEVKIREGRDFAWSAGLPYN